jgi:hypothetical protein
MRQRTKNTQALEAQDDGFMEGYALAEYLRINACKVGCERRCAVCVQHAVDVVHERFSALRERAKAQVLKEKASSELAFVRSVLAQTQNA